MELAPDHGPVVYIQFIDHRPLGANQTNHPIPFYEKPERKICDEVQMIVFHIGRTMSFQIALKSSSKEGQVEQKKRKRIQMQIFQQNEKKVSRQRLCAERQAALEPIL